MSSIKDLLRQCISPFIQGPEIEALLGALEEDAILREKMTLAAYDQLFISSASGSYIDRLASEIGLIRPESVGLDDLVFKNLSIAITANKQVIKLVHDVLETFYGPDVVRATITCAASETYDLDEGMQLILNLDGKEFVYEVLATDFPSGQLDAVSAQQLASVLTKYIRQSGSEGFADVSVSPTTGEKFIRIIGGAKGPTGVLQVLGGELQVILKFPNMIEYPAPPPLNWTGWIITKKGSTIRFSWYGNADPHLETVKSGDRVLIYGSGFTGVGTLATDLRGTFEVKTVQSGGVYSALNPDGAAYFEIENPFALIQNGESIVISQGTQNALRFFTPVKAKPYLRDRYALAWEPEAKGLKIYLPAVTKVVRRELEGSAHLHLGKSTAEFIGVRGSDSIDDDRLRIINDYAFKYKDGRSDIKAYSGTVTTDSLVLDIEYIFRENGWVTVVTTEPHELQSIDSTSIDEFNSANTYTEGELVNFNGFIYQALKNNPAVSVDPSDLEFWGKYIDDSKRSNEIVTISDVQIIADEGEFNGPYVYDPEARYSLGAKSSLLKEKILAGNSYRVVQVDTTSGVPEGTKYVMFNLGKNNQEEPVPIVGLLSNSIIFSSAYKFKSTHDVDSEIVYLDDNKAVISPFGDDYPMYVTGTVAGRIYCEKIIEEITALGIQLEIIIVYPDSTGWAYGFLDPYGENRVNDVVDIYGDDSI